MLEHPSAQTVTELDLSGNTHLTWRCCEHLVPLLGYHSHSHHEQQQHQQQERRASEAGSSLDLFTEPQGLQLQQQQKQQQSRRGSEAGGGQQQPRPQLQRLCLAGVQVGDRGVMSLCEGLRSRSSLKVLVLARCEIKDLGGCAVAAALVMNRGLQEVNLGWNALSHEAARSLAVAMR